DAAVPGAVRVFGQQLLGELRRAAEGLVRLPQPADARLQTGEIAVRLGQFLAVDRLVWEPLGQLLVQADRMAVERLGVGDFGAQAVDVGRVPGDECGPLPQLRVVRLLVEVLAAGVRGGHENLFADGVQGRDGGETRLRRG